MMARRAEVWKLIRSLLRRLSSALRLSHLLVDGGQLFIGGFQFFLRGFQFFVDALQFLVGGLDFFVGRLEFFVGRFVLLLDGLEVVARLGQIALELGDAARMLPFCWRRGPVLASTAASVAVGAVPASRALSASSNRIRKQRSRKFFSGMTSTLIVRVLPSCLTRTFSLRTALLSFLALLMAARSGSIKPSRAIFSTSKLALPVGGSRYAPVGPRNCRTCRSALIEHAGRRELVDREAVGLALGVEFAARTFHRSSVPLPATAGRAGSDRGDLRRSRSFLTGR